MRFVVFIVLTFAAGVLAQTTNTFPTTGNAGAGTTSPRQQLEVDAAPATDEATPIAAISSTSVPSSGKWSLAFGPWVNGYFATIGFDKIYNNSAAHTGDLFFATSPYNSSAYAPPLERMRITNAGNVGIGTATPKTNSALDVNGWINSNIGIQIESATGFSYRNASVATNGDLGMVSPSFGTSNFIWWGDSAQGNRNYITGSGANLIFGVSPDNTQGAERMRITGAGNVGIGTASPQYTLDVNGTARFQNAVTFNGTVNMPSVGTFSAPSGQVLNISGTPAPGVSYPGAGTPIGAITGPASIPGTMWSLAFGPNNGAGYYSAIGFDAVHTNNYDQTGDLFFATSPFPATGGQYTAPQERMRITASGLVGIGTSEETCTTTTTAQCLLAVKGAVVAQEVVVNSAGADYVFDPDYRLAPLNEVADYVKANRHLPDVPSAAEMQASGVSVGEMQAKLLAKVEELTLHLIEVNEKVRRLEMRNRELEERRADPVE